MEIPATVTVIEDQAFGLCESLSEIDLPSGLTSIGYGAFRDCSALETLAIPAGVTVLGADGDQRITADELAERARTINYEVTTSFSPRVLKMPY